MFGLLMLEKLLDVLILMSSRSLYVHVQDWPPDTEMSVPVTPITKCRKIEGTQPRLRTYQQFKPPLCPVIVKCGFGVGCEGPGAAALFPR